MKLEDLAGSYKVGVFFAFLALCGVSAFFPGLSGGFVLDDGFNILQNRLLYIDELVLKDLVNAALSFHDGSGLRPLPMLSFALDYWRSGSMDPATFKATNLFVHGLTAFFLSFFLDRLLVVAGWRPEKAVRVAAIMSLIWAVHPMQVSSVLYVVQRMQTMATLFVVLALWAYICMRIKQIDGLSRGRLQGGMVIIFGFLALACKEDAALLVIYFLAMELTVLRFRAEEPEIVRGFKQSYSLIVIVGLLAYLFWIVPHYWSWEAYSVRDFSSFERLMTQPRILVMYLGQILIPYPDFLTFLYDDLEVSRGLLSPLTTLPSIILVAGLLISAWRLRTARPFFSLGVMLYFGGHLITSNVIPLELAFEHRNHFPLIGVVIAVSDLSISAWERYGLSKCSGLAVVSVLLVVLSSCTVIRSYTWGDTVRHAEKMVRLAPSSHRAWMQLSGAYFARYNESGSPSELQHAAEVNAEGLEHVVFPPLASNLVIYKSLLGTVTEDDWTKYYHVLEVAPASWQDQFSVWTLMRNVDRGIGVDPDKVVEAIDILVAKSTLKKEEYQRVAVFTYVKGDPELALPYFALFVTKAPKGDRAVATIIAELEDEGRKDWVDQLRLIEAAK